MAGIERDEAAGGGNEVGEDDPSVNTVKGQSAGADADGEGDSEGGDLEDKL